MTGGASVRLEDVAFSYGRADMRFDLAIPAGQRLALMGPSGSGKTTLLHLVAGFEKPLSGRLVIGGEDMAGRPPHARPVSMVFQDNNLFGHLDVASNVSLGRSPALKLTAADRAEVLAAIARVGLGGKEDRLPGALSGGERQRVALARVIVRARPVLLLDEPFASLDAALRADMLDLLAGLHAERAMTLIMVTHQAEDARRLCERLVTLSDGRVAADEMITDGR